MEIATVVMLLSVLPLHLRAQRVVIAGQAAGSANKEILVIDRNNDIEYKPIILSRATTDDRGHFSTSFHIGWGQFLDIKYESGVPMTIWVSPCHSIQR